MSDKTPLTQDSSAPEISAREAESRAAPRPVLEAMKAAELSALGNCIIDSGALGRSQTYPKLLRFLVDAALAGHVPRELDIAIGALGRDENFDVSSDSAVRVAVHQLRKKLASYYADFEPEATVRLVLPKGRHSLFIEHNARAPEPKKAALLAPPEESLLTKTAGLIRQRLTPALLLLMLIALTANLALLSDSNNAQGKVTAMPASSHPLWASVLSDDKPLLIVMGDYYIFGELNANGNVARMVREFTVNSSSDLEEFRFGDIEQSENYLDLDLSYIPEGLSLIHI